MPLVEQFTEVPDPHACAARIRRLPFPLWLDSSATGSPQARYSYVTADPSVVIRGFGARTEIARPHTGDNAWTPIDGHALAAGREVMRPFLNDPVPGLPPFQGGLAGYLGYEFAGALERVPAPHRRDRSLPDVVLALYDWVIAWDHETADAWIISTGVPAARGERRRRAETRLRRIKELVAGAASVHHMAPGLPPSDHQGSVETAGVVSTFSAADYRASVTRVRDYIVAGDIFQANLSQQFSAPLPCQPFELYARLRSRNPAPFAAYFEVGSAAILSVSPERFLKVGEDGSVETRPIKGTRPRGADPADDVRLAHELLSSEKDRAENVMIVDLLRNDLSRVCRAGSIHVPTLCALESHPTVHHLVSTVEGQLAGGEDALTLLAAVFPGGSITGAPKVRAMEIIAELEPTARSVYCGAIGYVGFGGAMDTSIAIRTAIAEDGKLYFNAGGGIVADSDPDAEYRETLDKAQAFIQVLSEHAAPEASVR
ncbi:MAG: aminodeoxychorismate synthase component I [Gemmatimonadetes bacterium]|nr:aminodeoxychorismate synthase component I [Gemmatimonadota bacterium]